MDVFTHALLPYLLGKISKVKKEYVAALVLGGIAPDFDFLILWINSVYPNFFLTTHRGITHSFFFGFLTILVILYLATRENVLKKIRRYVRFDPEFSTTALVFAYAGVVIHLFLDFVTTRGIPLFFPLARTNYSAEIFFFTDTYLTILSLGIVIYLFKRPVHKNTISKFLILFIIVFGIMGGLRLAEKNGALEFSGREDTSAYPTMDPFEWYVLKEDKETIKVYKYIGHNSSYSYNETFLRMNILSNGDGLGSALDRAGELPQVKMLKWRAYSIANNASYEDGTWIIEYYDPLRKATIREAPQMVRRAFSRMASLEVMVAGEKAVILESKD